MTTSNKPSTLVIYHGNCADGFTAAWVINKALNKRVDLEFFPGLYGDPLPPIKHRDVILADFSYKRAQIKKICEEAKSVLILDHHKSAEADLRGLEDEVENIDVVFDMERSGAMLAWDFYFSSYEGKINKSNRDCIYSIGHVPPMLVQYVQDRDLWRFKLPDSKKFSIALFSYEYTFENWDYVENNWKTLIREGTSILRKHNKDIAELIKANKDRRECIAGFKVPIINIPYMLGSDTCAILAKGEPFAVYYYDLAGTRYFGLRSEPNGMDVSKIAQGFGGGGHKQAAGFRIKNAGTKLMGIDIAEYKTII